MPSVFAQEHDHSAHQHSTHDHAATGKHDHGESEKGPHGGVVQTVGSHTIETVFVPRGIMFMLLDKEGKVLAAPKASGALTLRVDDDTKEYPYELKPLKNNAIGVGVDLSKIIGRTIHMDVTLDGIAAQPVSFHAMGIVKDDTLADAVLISLQATCPVSGKKLGSMGAPPKIMVEGKPLFVCCAGCSDKVKKSPQQYLTKYYEAKGEQVRPGVFKATLADAQAIAAQKVCPVMDEPLGGMGAPLKVDVKGRAVYICCAGCAKKLHAEPDVYLAKLKKLGVQPPAME
jgi:YHS domain-containing protein